MNTSSKLRKIRTFHLLPITRKFHDTFDCLKRLGTEVEVRGKQATKAVFSECVLCIQSFLCFCSSFLKTCDPIRRCRDAVMAVQLWVTHLGI